MTVSNRPQSSENLISVNSKRPSANSVPLTEERLAVLGHEIRNPLSAMSYALQAWPSSKDDPQLTDNLLQIMRRQVSQLTRLCDDLLDTGRSARGNLSIRRASVDVRQAIQNACEELEPTFDKCGCTMTVALGDVPLTLIGDESRLTQVFANVMHNSAKFTDRNGHLHISLDRYHDTAVIRFRDNGRGICPDQLQSIFLPHNPSMRCCEARSAGLGIGLRLAKTIVELHGGTIEAFSEGLGHGSTIEVRLPIIADKPTDRPTDKPNPSSLACVPDRDIGSHLPHYRVVVVDDDRSMRFLMSQLLQNLDQSVTVADNGDTAIEIIMRDQPHVVFLDLQMNGISGYEVARQLRSRVELNNVVLIALSGNADEASRRLAEESGFDQYLVKPMSMAELTETLLSVGELSAC